MIRNRFVIKGVASLCVVLTLSNLFIPTISYALTSGPTAPEYTSFEPVDTTDMVNLATGDFTYNIPLLEVPGPEGGYPLSLSYHAGIQPNEEASWVGLGWTLNPGAINRTVNGYSDDRLKSRQTIQDFWEGGETYSTERNYSVPFLEGIVTASYTSVTSNDTYQGFSKNSYLGININHAAMINSAAGFTPKNSSRSRPDNFIKASGTRMLQLRSGATIGSKSVSSYTSVAGFTASSTNAIGSAGDISSYTKTLSSRDAMHYSVKQKYTRYWSNSSNDLYTFGSLYVTDANDYINSDEYTNTESDNAFYASDIVSLYDKNDTKQSETRKQSGGSLPAYDYYSVLGQGIGGRISPYIFENGDLFGQSAYEQVESGNVWAGAADLSKPIVKYQSSVKFNKDKVNFRFVNDFSNKAIAVPKGVNNSIYYSKINAQSSYQGFNYADQHLAGSKHIEWFTNEDIAKGEAAKKNFMDYYKDSPNLYRRSPLGNLTWLGDRKLTYDVVGDYLQPEMVLPKFCRDFNDFHVSGAFLKDSYPGPGEKGDVLEHYYGDVKYGYCNEPTFNSLKPREYDISGNIGGFMVTNESGVTYHYALPAYTYNEYTRTKVKNPEKGAATFREEKKAEPYAYAWLLTGITGPDYVDRGEKGFSNEDWGYWVKLDYGLWTDSYQWRTPHTGYNSDVTNDVESFSYGIKELYYLDAIETRTHKAFFVKSMRRDGKGVTSRLEGGSEPRRYDIPIKLEGKQGNLTYSVSPVSTMKLDEIYLYKKSNLTATDFKKQKGEKYTEATIDNPHIYSYRGSNLRGLPIGGKENVDIITEEDKVEVKYHNGHLVLDDDDIAQNKESLRDRALRVIEFDSDYSLGNKADGVPNSFAHVSDVQDCPDADYIGPDRIQCVSYSNYDISNCYQQLDSDGFAKMEDFFYGRAKDDLLKTSNLGNIDPCIKMNHNFSGGHLSYTHLGKLTLKSIKNLGEGGEDIMPTTAFHYNKNLPYHPDKYDNWNFYKSDYYNRSESNDASRRTSEDSQQNVDAWSLSSITTPLGSTVNIDYESDSYAEAVLNPNTVLPIHSMVPIENEQENKVLVFFKEKGLSLDNYYDQDDIVDLKYMFINRVDDGQNILTESNLCPERTRTGTRRSRCSDQFVQDALVLAVNPSSYVEEDTDPLASGYPSLLVESASLYKAASERTEQRRGSSNGAIVEASVTPYFISGFSQAKRKTNGIGGGLRVKSISVENGTSATDTYKTEYLYEDPQSGRSTGVTAYEPYILPIIKYPYRDVSDVFDPSTETETKRELSIFNFNITRNIIDKIAPGAKKVNELLPFDLDIFGGDDSRAYDSEKLEYYRNQFQLTINESVSEIMALSSELPAPGVLYENVIVNELGSASSPLTSTLHNFTVFNKEMVVKEEIDASEDAVSEKKALLIKNSASRLGSIKSVSTYGSDGSLLTKTDYNYLHNEGGINDYEQALANRYDNQGVIQQSFNERKKVKQEDDSYIDKAIATFKSEYPTVLTNVRVTNYKTGTSSATHNLAFDFFSGVPIEIMSEDSYGNRYVSVTTPAYHLYEQMGPKVRESNNKHMLTQEAEKITYKINAGFDPKTFPQTDYQPEGLVSASVQTWSDQVPVYERAEQDVTDQQANIWRKHRSFGWAGNGIVLQKDGTAFIKDFQPFEAWQHGATPGEQWEQQSEITRYNPYSHALEAKDINGNYAATRMDEDHRLVLATAANARYDEMGYSGAEGYTGNDRAEAGVARGDGLPSVAFAHTGTYSLKVPTGKQGFQFVTANQPGKPYHASVWVYLPGNSETEDQMQQVQLYYTVDGIEKGSAYPVPQINKSKNWYLLNLDIETAGGQEIVIGCRNGTQRNVYFDDFRAHPLDASMMSYVYNSDTDELTHILDNNNIYTYYEYDAAGRLIRTSRERMNFDFGEGKRSFRADQILQETIYNYKNYKK